MRLWWRRNIYNTVLYELPPRMLAKTISGVLTMANVFGANAAVVLATGGFVAAARTVHEFLVPSSLTAQAPM